MLLISPHTPPLTLKPSDLSSRPIPLVILSRNAEQNGRLRRIVDVGLRENLGRDQAARLGPTINLHEGQLRPLLRRARRLLLALPAARFDRQVDGVLGDGAAGDLGRLPRDVRAGVGALGYFDGGGRARIARHTRRKSGHLNEAKKLNKQRQRHDKR